MRICLLAVGTVFLFLVTNFSQATNPTASSNLEARRAELTRLLNEEWEYTLKHAPELATQVGDNRYNDRLSDLSDQAISEGLEHARQMLPKFEAIDTTGFPEQERLNQVLMVRSLRQGLD